MDPAFMNKANELWLTRIIETLFAYNEMLLDYQESTDARYIAP